MELMVTISGQASLKMSELEAVTLTDVMAAVKQACIDNPSFFNRTQKAVVNDAVKCLQQLDKAIADSEIRAAAGAAAEAAEKAAKAAGQSEEEIAKAGKEARKAYIKAAKGTDSEEDETEEEVQPKKQKASIGNGGDAN